jgi:hypothetical protein
MSDFMNHRVSKSIIFIGLCCLLGVKAQAQTSLTVRAQVSLLTCSPSDKAAYTLYGHTAVRVRDTTGIDVVFNYGLFDFSQSHFIYRFTKGETDYVLGACHYNDFLMDYQMRGSEVYEQTLNLTQSEKDALFQALIVNIRPENRVYRYSFFYDNCSTRPAAMIERYVDGHIDYEGYSNAHTFRDEINRCTRDDPWLTFGCDLVLGCPADRQMTLHESFFLPANVKNAFSYAKIVRSDGTSQPLVAATSVLVESISDDEPEPAMFVTPLLCGWLLFAFAAMLTWMEWRTKKYFRWFDVALFLMAGIAGCVLYFLCFISVHRGIWPNVSVIWLHPFHLVGVACIAVKKLNKLASCYHLINFAAILLLPVVWFAMAQHLNMAFIPLILTLWMRSGYDLVKKKICK